MNDPLVLTALDGREPLGFLAALGAVRLLDEAERDVLLSWDRRTAIAELHGLDDVDEVLDLLISAATSGSWMPRLPTEWLPKMGQTGGDRARIERSQFGERQRAVADWCAALWTDLATEDRKASDGSGELRPVCVCTPFYAPMGKQSMNQMFSACHEQVLLAPRERLREALFGWRRVRGFTGESLDIRAFQSAAESASGESSPAGVPGATWLALAALPLFRMTGDGAGAHAVGWHRVRRRPRFVWPLWWPPLDVDGIEVLLDHPTMCPRFRQDGEIPRPLGVFEVREAVRRPTSAGKSAGVLAALERR